MTTIEEQIWDYIDGKCDAETRRELEVKIAADGTYQAMYREFMAVNMQLRELALDEPPMAFNRKVMDLVALEVAPVSLKTRVDQRIITGIAIFFIVMIAAVIGYAFSQADYTLPKMTFSFSFDSHLTPLLIKGFLFADALLGLLYLDALLRKKGYKKRVA